MILTLTLALVASAPAAPRSTAVRADDPPIHVWLNSDNTFTTGDRARVHIRAEQDGYVVVLRADGDGRVRVLFPLDPGADDFVRGGDKREVRSRGDREAFLVDEREGSGVVLAAWSATAFKFDEFVRGDHWDYSALDTRQSSDDKEAALVDVVQRMAGENRFDYDVVTYTVGSIAAYYHRPYYGGYGWGGWGWGGWPYGRRFRIGIGIGYPYYGGYGCDPFWGGYGCGFYDPFFYSGYYYRPYRTYGFAAVRSYPSFGGSVFGRIRAGLGGGFGGIQPRPRYSVATVTAGRTIMSRFPTSSSWSTGTRVRERSFSGSTSGGSGFAHSGSTSSSRRDSHESWSGPSRSSGGSTRSAPSYRGGGSTSSSRGGGWSGGGGARSSGGGGRSSFGGGGRSSGGGGGGGRSGGGGGRRH